MDTDPNSTTHADCTGTNATAYDPLEQWTKRVADSLDACVFKALADRGGALTVLREWQDNARGRAHRIAADIMERSGCSAEHLTDPATQVSFRTRRTNVAICDHRNSDQLSPWYAANSVSRPSLFAFSESERLAQASGLFRIARIPTKRRQ